MRSAEKVHTPASTKANRRAKLCE